MNVLEELEEAKAVYEGLQQMYSGEMVDGETVMEELKNIVLYYVNKGACAPFSIVHYDFF